MAHNIHDHRILILDFGSQYTQLIARRVRDIGVYCEVRAFDITDEELQAFNPKGILLAGGPESVTELGGPRAPEGLFELGIPVLGICYGMQAMAEQLGGRVASSEAGIRLCSGEGARQRPAAPRHHRSPYCDGRISSRRLDEPR